MAIPIFRIPNLVICLILSQIGNFDILMLALTSRRAKKYVTKNARIQISVDLSETSYRIQFGRINMNPYKQGCLIKILNNRIVSTTTLNFGPIALRCKFVSNSVHLHSDDKVTALVAIIDFLVDSFQLKTAERFFVGRNASDNYQIVRKFKWLNLKPNQVIWYGPFPNEIMLGDFLDTYADLKMMRLQLCLDPSTVFSYPNFTNLRIKYFEVHGSKWMNVDNLIDLTNCRRVCLGYNDATGPFTVEELIIFIKKWLEIDCALKRVSIRMRAPKWNKLVRGIGGVQKVGRIYKIFKEDGVEAANFRWRKGFFIFAEKAYSDRYLR